MSFARTTPAVPGVFYRDIGRTALGLNLGALGVSRRGMGAVNSTPLPQDVVNYPYSKYSAQTLQLQNALNAILIKRGFCPLIADGKLGPKTCGAGLQIYDDDPTSSDVMLIPTMQQSPAQFQPSTCEDSATIQKVTDPGGCGTGPAAPALTPAQQAAQQAALLPPSSLSLTSGKTLAVAAAVLAALGIVYYVKR